jgi:hypothetical protein
VDHLFRLSDELLNSVEQWELDPYVDEKRKVKRDIIIWPYKQFSIETPSTGKPNGTVIIHHSVVYDNWLRFDGATYTIDGKISHSLSDNQYMTNIEKVTDQPKEILLGDLTSLALSLLVILNRPGQESEVKHNASKLIRERSKRADTKATYVTTLKLSKAPQAPVGRGDPTGETRIAHDRRGHYRNQRYGPGGSFKKRIWVNDTKIHPDQTPTKEREAYNVIP